MKKPCQLCAAIALTLLLTLPVLAGNMDNGVARQTHTGSDGYTPNGDGHIPNGDGLMDNAVTSSQSAEWTRLALQILHAVLPIT